jgi:two-component system NtrC family sensor kinase
MSLADEDEDLFAHRSESHPFERASEVVRRYTSVRPPPGVTIELPVVREDAVLRTVAELGPKLETAGNATALAEMFVAMIGPLFPDRHVDVLLCEPSGEGTQAFRVGSTRGRAACTNPEVSRDAIVARGLTRSSVERATMIVSPVPAATNHTDVVGMERLLADEGTTIGLLVVEHARDVAMSDADLTRIDVFADILERAMVGLLARRDTAALRRVVRGLAAPGPMPIALFDRDGKLEEHSDAWAELFSLAKRGLGTAEWKKLADAIERVADGRDSVARIDLRAAGGMDVPVSTIACDVVAAGKHVAVVARDLATIRELEARVAHAERLASLGQFVASIAHELNNPLTITSANAEFLDRRFELGEVSSVDRQKVRRIIEATQRMQRFARDIVSYARPSGGNPAPVDVARLVRHVGASCEHIAGCDDIILDLVTTDDVGLVWGVRDQLEQVLVNLVTNACHAAGPRGHVRVKACRPSPGVVEFRVSDDGPGVPDTMRDDIFRPFFTTKRDGHGTGLGLAIVRNLVERHAGKIAVESQEMIGGATFVVTLPASPYVTTE